MVAGNQGAGGAAMAVRRALALAMVRAMATTGTGAGVVVVMAVGEAAMVEGSDDEVAWRIAGARRCRCGCWLEESWALGVGGRWAVGRRGQNETVVPWCPPRMSLEAHCWTLSSAAG
jgi:hypothetical protein